MRISHNPDKVFGALLNISFVFSFFLVSFRIARDIHWGGNSWKQGDYLINSTLEPIRRGHLGSAILWVSDFIGMSPLWLVGFVQAALVLILYAFFWMLLVKIQNRQLSLVIALSSAMFTTFWVADPQGSVRKELIAFSGLAVFANGMVANRTIQIIIGTILISLSIISHEAMILMAFTLAAIILLLGKYKTQKLLCSLVAVTVCGAVLYTIWYTFRNSQVADPATVCLPLLERGLEMDICSGAIRWLQYDTSFGIERVARMLSGTSMVKFSFMYAVAIAPFVFISLYQKNPSQFLLTILVLAIPFLPLYFIAIDWGRWMSLHVFSLAIFFSVALISGRANHSFRISNNIVWGLVAVGLVLSPGHVLGIIAGGALGTVVSLVMRAINSFSAGILL